VKEELCNHLKQIRMRLGLSQQDLATKVGVSRQTISGVESGQTALSITVALRLARVLGCRVEDLFWLEQEPLTVMAIPGGPLPNSQPLRVSLAQIGGQWIAYPLVGLAAFRNELIPADGEMLDSGEGTAIAVRLLDDPSHLLDTVVVAGCAPALSLWAQATERWHPGLRVHLTFANSMTALARLMQGQVHIAGIHLYCPDTQTFNIPFVQQALKSFSGVDECVLVINLGVWEEGFLVAPGNPKGIESIADLARPDVRLINREVGSGARALLDDLLKEASLTSTTIAGYNHLLPSHQAVAAAIAAGEADVGVSVAAIAQTYNLGFVALRPSRYDLVTFQSYLQEPPVQKLLGTLGHQRVLSQLQTLGGYDTQLTGEVIAKLNSQTTPA
jgi:molybdate-binding protein/DNA-binding XRE family transcriptional regulator